MRERERDYSTIYEEPKSKAQDYLITEQYPTPEIKSPQNLVQPINFEAFAIK